MENHRINYRCDFYKKEVSKDTGQIKFVHLGFVNLNNDCTTYAYPLQAKAFKFAPSTCVMADKLVFTKL